MSSSSTSSTSLDKIEHQASREYFAYTRLTEQQNEIRLLRLLPGSGSTEIQCNLIHVKLDSTPGYEAISYTWGNPKVTNPIRIDGKSFLTMGNSRDALRELRLFNTPRLLWIDAICINQDDLDEKSCQVLLMTKIYESASRVVIWLSPPLHDPDSTTEFLHHFYEFSVNSIKRDRTLLPRLRDEVMSQLRSPAGTAARNIFCHPYFTRIWVFQEIAVAREVVVTYGHCNLNWDALVSLAYLSKYSIFADLLMVSPSESIYDPEIFGLPPGCEVVIQMEESRQARAVGIQHGRRPSDAFQTMETNIIWCARRAATFPHDKIYALIGMSTDIVQYVDFTPNYKQPVEEVYTQWTESIYYQRRSLALLAVAGIGFPRKLTDLPSFVPDLSCPPRASSLWHHDKENKFRAGAGYKANMDLHPSGNGAIVIRGIRLGQVIQASAVLEEGFFVPSTSMTINRTKALHNWLEDAELVAMKLAMDPYPSNWRKSDFLHNAFWRTLIANRSNSRVEAPSFYLFHYLLLRYSLARELGLTKNEISGFERVKEEYDPAGDPQYFDQNGENANIGFKSCLALAAAHRRLGIVNFGTPNPLAPGPSTNLGFLALVPPLTRAGVEGCWVEEIADGENPEFEGDWVYLFEGAETPFVVRFDRREKAKMASGAPTGYIVGECYVHGVMNGDFVQQVIEQRGLLKPEYLFIK